MDAKRKALQVLETATASAATSQITSQNVKPAEAGSQVVDSKSGREDLNLRSPWAWITWRTLPGFPAMPLVRTTSFSTSLRIQAVAPVTAQAGSAIQPASTPQITIRAFLLLSLSPSDL
jgi:hypothetical protein